jgi:tight adherence protein F
VNLKSTNRRCARGNFSVEFAIVGLAFSFLLVFSADVIIKLAIKGKLERMAYSAASVIKERTQLFDEIYTIDKDTSTEGESTYNYVKASMARTINNFNSESFGFSLDVFTYEDSTVTLDNAYAANTIACTIKEPADDLFITTGWGNTLTLYQVTLCYETDNWYGSLVGETFNRVSTYAAVMGR